MVNVAGEQAKSSAQPTKPAKKKTGYAPVNGLKMYYEITGEGKPAVYIHPVVGHCGLIPGLTWNRQWIAIATLTKPAVPILHVVLVALEGRTIASTCTTNLCSNADGSSCRQMR